MYSSDVARNRSMLLSARMRFSPETQPVKETAIDKIIEQNLLLANHRVGLTLEQIQAQGALCFPNGTPAIRTLDIERSLNRLVHGMRLVVSDRRGHRTYRLSDQALNELSEVQQSTEKRFRGVVDRVFSRAGAELPAYTEPFLECLCVIFWRLGEAYVRLIKGDITPADLVRSASIVEAMQKIKQQHASIDPDTFEKGVFAFFQEPNPDYDAIKWNMAQNCYVAKALGLDPSGSLLSKEVFANATFYLDTNVVIHALEPKARHHRSFEALSNACRTLDIELRVSQISLNELLKTVEYYRWLIPKVVNQIPDDTAPKVRGVFFELCKEEQRSGAALDLDKLFVSFDRPMETLSKSYRVELVDDSWFDEQDGTPETLELTKKVRDAFQSMRGTPKRQTSAVHDALLMRWVQRERDETSKRVVLVTLDTTLPLIQPDSTKPGPARAFAMTLDAVLQWISPIAVKGDIEDEFAAIFSEAVKYQLLPQESFFDLKDFLMFAVIEWECKELPATDVEDCVRYIKASAPDLDPSNPADREKIARYVAKFFADPSREYKQDVHRLETEIGILKKKLSDRAERTGAQRLKASAWRRLVIAGLVFLAYEVATGLVIKEFGQGANLLQKVTNHWVFPSLGVPLAVGFAWFLLGKRRIRVLGWPFTRFLKSN